MLDSIHFGLHFLWQLFLPPCRRHSYFWLTRKLSLVQTRLGWIGIIYRGHGICRVYGPHYILLKIYFLAFQVKGYNLQIFVFLRDWFMGMTQNPKSLTQTKVIISERSLTNMFVKCFSLNIIVPTFFPKTKFQFTNVFSDFIWLKCLTFIPTINSYFAFHFQLASGNVIVLLQLLPPGIYYYST